MSYTMRDAYGEVGAVPSGIFWGLVGYQLTFRVAQEWSGRVLPRWRRALLFGEQTDLDTRLAAVAHALLQLVGLLQLPLLWSRKEHAGPGPDGESPPRLHIISDDLLFFAWVMCGFLIADLTLVLAYSDTLGSARLRVLHRASGLALFGLSAIRKVGGYYVLHVLLWECVTPFRTARWLGSAVHTRLAQRGDDAGDDISSSRGLTTLRVGAATLELLAYGVLAWTLLPSLAAAAMEDFPPALASLSLPALAALAEGTADAEATQETVVFALVGVGLGGQLICLALGACECVADLGWHWQVCGKGRSSTKPKAD